MRMILGAAHRLFGNFGWPIAEKEARAQARRVRYFWLQLVYLVVLAVAVVIAVGSVSGSPESLSRQLFAVFFLMQNGLIFLIFPALAATSISAERADKSFDLVMTTDLRPSEIVWGKFLGILGNCCTFLLAALPLLAVCILFGGVSMSEALDNYLLLFVQAGLISMYGISVSAGSEGNLRAIVGTYVISLIVGAFSLVSFEDVLFSRSGQLSIIDAMLSEAAPADRPWVFGASVCAVVLVFAYSFVAAVQRLTPPEGNRSTPSRVLIGGGLTILLVAVLVYAIGGRGTVRFAGAEYSQMVFAFMVVFGLLSVFLLPIFAGDRVETPRRVDLFQRRHPRITLWSWLLQPGGIRGLAYALLWVMLICGTLVLLVSGDTVPRFPSFPKSAFPTTIELYLATFLLLGLAGVLNCALAFLLAACDIRGLLNWALVVAISLLLNVYPLVFVIGDHARQFLHGYPLSIIVVLRKAWYVRRGETSSEAIALFSQASLLYVCLTAGVTLLACVLMVRRKVPIFAVRSPARVPVKAA
ncbi:MAG: hypothetical protein AAF581_18145 [Planctomycetota bacterium]